MLSILDKTIGRQSKSFSQQIGFEICNNNKKKKKKKKKKKIKANVLRKKKTTIKLSSGEFSQTVLNPL